MHFLLTLRIITLHERKEDLKKMLVFLLLCMFLSVHSGFSFNRMEESNQLYLCVYNGNLLNTTAGTFLKEMQLQQQRETFPADCIMWQTRRHFIRGFDSICARQDPTPKACFYSLVSTDALNVAPSLSSNLQTQVSFGYW